MIKKLFDRKIVFKEGIANFWDSKWIIVLFLYIMAFGLMSTDQYFGKNTFVWVQTTYIGLISLLLVGVIAFELNLLGKSKGINLFIQFFLLVPFTVFLARIIGVPVSKYSSFEVLAESFKKYIGLFPFIGNLINDLIDYVLTSMPVFIVDIVRAPGVFLTFIILCALLSLSDKKNFKIAVIFGFFIYCIFSIISSMPSSGFLSGTFLLFVGIALHYKDVNHTIKDEIIIKKLRVINDKAERVSSIRILKNMEENSKISDKTIVSIVKRVYNEYGYSGENINLIAQTITHRLIYEHNLIKIIFDKDGVFFKPSYTDKKYINPLGEISFWMRNVVCFIFAVIYWINPITIIPDFIPVIGKIDDLLIIMASSNPMIRYYYENQKKED